MSSGISSPSGVFRFLLILLASVSLLGRLPAAASGKSYVQFWIMLLVDFSEFSARCFIADTARSGMHVRDGYGKCECSDGSCHSVSNKVESLPEHSLRRSHLQQDVSTFFLSKI